MVGATPWFEWVWWLPEWAGEWVPAAVRDGALELSQADSAYRVAKVPLDRHHRSEAVVHVKRLPAK